MNFILNSYMKTVLSNGEKTDNKQLESLLLEDGRIARAVVFGSGRFVNGVILERRPSMETENTFLESICKMLCDTLKQLSNLTTGQQDMSKCETMNSGKTPTCKVLCTTLFSLGTRVSKGHNLPTSCPFS